tara:strand:+ start:2012 stop:2875 length:864 start_codon:yes stop_codon:yes gene_type:complete
MSKETLFVSFSGGRTSAYMCWWLLENKADEYDLIFVFANTGQEHEKTLEFVDRCDREFGLNLVWVEAVVHHGEKKGCTHRIVTFETASRAGEPFEEVIKKYGIPNATFLNCNRELKINAMWSYKRSIGFRAKHLSAIGIRVDEIDRMSPTAKSDGLLYPLISMKPTTKAEIRHWWAQQEFDLDIPEHLGNCVTCWKKSDRKLMTIARHEPERFEFFDRMERTYPDAGAGGGGRVFFRRHRSSQDIIASSKIPFVEFVDHMPELQLKIGFEIDELDIESGCGESCEAA